MPNKLSSLQQILADCPERLTALQCGERKVSYQALALEVERLAKTFESLGIVKGAVLAFQIPSSIEFVIALLACIRNELFAAPLAAELSEAEVFEFLDRVRPNFALLRNAPQGVSFKDLGVPPTPLPADLTFLSFPKRSASFPKEKFPEGGFIRFTSGTTGDAKGVLIGTSSALQRINAAQEAFDLSQGERFLFAMPMPFHFVASILPALGSRATLIIPRSSHPEEFLRSCHAVNPEVIYGAPSHYEALVRSASRPSLASLRLAFSTSAALSLQAAQEFLSIYSKPIHQLYGIIEVGLPLGNLTHALSSPASIGESMPGYEVSLLDPESLLPSGSGQGIIALRGPGMFDAYISPLLFRDQILRDGWFISGDIAAYSADSGYRIVGRHSSIIHVAGHKVFPEEVEQTIRLHPLVREAHVYGETHALFGSIVVADITLASDSKISEEELIQFCRKRLSRIKIPQRINFVRALRQTRSGKLMRTPTEFSYA